jgi:hypothetical protein
VRDINQCGGDSDRHHRPDEQRNRETTSRAHRNADSDDRQPESVHQDDMSGLPPRADASPDVTMGMAA